MKFCWIHIQTVYDVVSSIFMYLNRVPCKFLRYVVFLCLQIKQCDQRKLTNILWINPLWFHVTIPAQMITGDMCGMQLFWTGRVRRAVWWVWGARTRCGAILGCHVVWVLFVDVLMPRIAYELEISHGRMLSRLR